MSIDGPGDFNQLPRSHSQEHYSGDTFHLDEPDARDISGLFHGLTDEFLGLSPQETRHLVVEFNTLAPQALQTVEALVGPDIGLVGVTVQRNPTSSTAYKYTLHVNNQSADGMRQGVEYAFDEASSILERREYIQLPQFVRQLEREVLWEEIFELEEIGETQWGELSNALRDIDLPAELQQDLELLNGPSERVKVAQEWVRLIGKVSLPAGLREDEILGEPLSLEEAALEQALLRAVPFREALERLLAAEQSDKTRLHDFLHGLLAFGRERSDAGLIAAVEKLIKTQADLESKNRRTEEIDQDMARVDGKATKEHRAGKSTPGVDSEAANIKGILRGISDPSTPFRGR